MIFNIPLMKNHFFTNRITLARSENGPYISRVFIIDCYIIFASLSRSASIIPVSAGLSAVIYSHFSSRTGWNSLRSFVLRPAAPIDESSTVISSGFHTIGSFLLAAAIPGRPVAIMTTPAKHRHRRSRRLIWQAYALSLIVGSGSGGHRVVSLFR